MQSKVRFVLALAGIAVLIAAAAVLSSSSGDGQRSAGDKGASGSSGATGPVTSGATGASDAGPSAKAGPDAGPLLRSGKLTKISVRRGETVRFRARSTAGDELHIHGYDRHVELPAGKTVSYRFKATIEGVFVIELHSSDEQVAELRVNP